jgi:hypothetical protein
VYQRRETQRVADWRKAVWLGMGSWSPEGRPTLHPFFVSEQGLWTQVLGACSPLSSLLPWGWGEYAWSQLAAMPLHFLSQPAQH